MNAPDFGGLVVGMHFREKEGVPAKSIVSNFIPPVELQLEREPQNAYDPFAVKVLYLGEHIGYIERGVAAFLATWMDQGIEYTATVSELLQIKNNLHPLVALTPIETA